MTPPPPDPTTESDRDAVSRAIIQSMRDHSMSDAVYPLVLADAVLAALAQRGRLVAAGEWVACKDRMPPTGRGKYWTYRPVFVCRDGGSYSDYQGPATFDDTDDKGPWYDYSYHGPAGVSHWRPLPPPPRVPGEGT